MTTLLILSGLPASGKTTMARKWVEEKPTERVRVNKDDLRRMAHNGTYLGRSTEALIDAMRDAAIAAMLGAGFSVVSDDTNLDPKKVDGLMMLAHTHGADSETQRLDTSIEECIHRDAIRRDSVGWEAITGMADRYGLR